MTPQRSILVTGGTGNLGKDLVPLLLNETAVKLVFTTRNAERLRASLPASATNTHVEEGEITDPIWVEDIIRKHAVDTVFLTIQGGGAELDTTLNFLDAMHRAGTVKQLVYVSLCGDLTSAAGIEALTRANSAGHVAVKIPIELKLKYTDYGWATTILGPSLFFSNDARSRTSTLKHGIFDEPLGPLGVSRVATADIALAARNIMFAPAGKYAGQKIQIGTHKLYTGADVAALWTRALGKTIQILGSEQDDMKKFEKEHAPLWGKAFARDVRLMYECLRVWESGMSGEGYERQVEVLGREATDYEGWVMEEGKVWLSKGETEMDDRERKSILRE